MKLAQELGLRIGKWSSGSKIEGVAGKQSNWRETMASSRPILKLLTSTLMPSTVREERSWLGSGGERIGEMRKERKRERGEKEEERKRKKKEWHFGLLKKKLGEILPENT